LNRYVPTANDNRLSLRIIDYSSRFSKITRLPSFFQH